MTVIMRCFTSFRLLNRPLFGLLGEMVSSGSTTSRLLSTEWAEFQVKPYKLHRMVEGPSTNVKCGREEAMKFYTEMITVRRLEAAANALYRDKSIRGFCHLYTGQEAVCVGMENALHKDDAVITAYRAHGWTYVRGVPLNEIFAELTGRRSGCSKGKGGSMHMYDRKFFGGNGIVGAQMPLGAGLAFAQKYTNSTEITVALCGDGAANQGQVFEVYNMAKLWSLPIIFVTENNGYGMGTPADRSSACTDYYTRGHYIPGVWVDGMDVLAVREATNFLAEQCRHGNGPFVLEVETYRYHGHSVSDPGTSYRTRDEVQEVRKSRDPISSFKSKITEAGLVTRDELRTIDTEVRKEIDEAVEFARSDLELDLDELYSDIYESCLQPTIRGITPFTTHTPPTSKKSNNSYYTNPSSVPAQ